MPTKQCENKLNKNLPELPEKILDLISKLHNVFQKLKITNLPELSEKILDRMSSRGADEVETGEVINCVLSLLSSNNLMDFISFVGGIIGSDAGPS